MDNLTKRILATLSQRKIDLLIRDLPKPSNLIDFCSNDYLGFSKSKEVKKLTLEILNDYPSTYGGTGSRLISGNHPLAEMVEHEITEFHQGEAGLLFNSGYDANLGFFSTIPKRGDTILFDEFVHASIRDGIRLNNAKSFSFKHNDISDFELKLNNTTGEVFVAVESIYSMDGDEAPLKLLDVICKNNGLHLIVDEAHSTGIIGEYCAGMCMSKNINPFARLYTFGKAMGCHGAIWITSQTVKEYLINFCRPFIYTTALPSHSLANILGAYQYLKINDRLVEILNLKIQLFKSEICNSNINNYFIQRISPIQSMIIHGNKEVISAMEELRNSGFNVKAIRQPTIPEGKERIRICLHAYNSDHEIKELVKILERISKQ